uniref:MATH domain-containing protein n=1 Tax=Ciona savignyi TaxID=51511 RepID=H2YBM5_CIOSA
MYDVRIADMDQRFQVLETTSYNGSFVWKIRDFSRRKREAVSGRTLSLYSQPFYTSRYGYKICARVYLNGDGMGFRRRVRSNLAIAHVIMTATLPIHRHITSIDYFFHSGKGTHMSLFFVVMKGEYDALLPWPFRQKVTLMLL